jgi:hypothetical protein
MRHIRASIAALLFLSVAGLGIWSALHPPLGHMFAPGATQIEVLQPSMRERIITYDAPGPAYAWRSTVGHELATHGWARPIWWQPHMSDTDTYLHVSSSWFGSIWDSVELNGEANVARISVRRWFELPWRWSRWFRDVLQNIAT